jgi:hypothetical protein
MLDKTICIRCMRKEAFKMVQFAPPSTRMALADQMMDAFNELWRDGLIALCPVTIKGAGFTPVDISPPKWCPHARLNLEFAVPA